MTRRILFYLKLIFAANLIVTMTEKQHFNDEQETKHLFSNVGYFILSKKGNLPHKYIQEYDFWFYSRSQKSFSSRELTFSTTGIL